MADAPTASNLFLCESERSFHQSRSQIPLNMSNSTLVSLRKNTSHLGKSLFYLSCEEVVWRRDNHSEFCSVIHLPVLESKSRQSPHEPCRCRRHGLAATPVCISYRGQRAEGFVNLHFFLTMITCHLQFFIVDWLEVPQDKIICFFISSFSHYNPGS